MDGARRYLDAAQTMLDKARDALESMAVPAPKSRADYLLDTIRANLDNPKLSDADFRAFMRNTLAVPAGQERKQ